MLHFVLITAFASPVLAQLPKDHPERNDLIVKRTEYSLHAERLAKEGKFTAAIAALEDRLAVEKKLYGENHAELEATLNTMAVYAVELKDFAQAAKLWKAQTAMSEKLNGAKHWRPTYPRFHTEQAERLAKLTDEDLKKWFAIRQLNDESQRLYAAGKLGECIKALRESLEGSLALLGENSLEYNLRSQQLGLVYSAAQQYAESIAVFEGLVKRNEAMFPDPHPDTMTNRFYLGKAHLLNRKGAEAEPHLARSLKEARVLFEEKGCPPLAILNLMRSMGEVHFAAQNWSKAKPVMVEARDFAEKQFGATSEALLYTLLDLGKLSAQANEFTEAEKFLKAAYELAGELYGAKHPKQAWVLKQLAEFHYQAANYPLCREEIEKAIAWLEATGKPSPLELLECRSILGQALAEVGTPEESFALHAELVRSATAIFGAKNPSVLTFQIRYAIACTRAGKFRESDDAFSEAEATANTLDSGGLNAAVVKVQRALIFFKSGEYTKAEPLLLEIRKLCEKHAGEDLLIGASVELLLGTLYLNMGNLRNAEAPLKKAAAIYRKALGSHPTTAKALSELARYHGELGDNREAFKLHLEAIEMLRNKLPAVHPRQLEELQSLGHLYYRAGNYPEAIRAYFQMLKIADQGGPAYREWFAKSQTFLGETQMRIDPKEALKLYRLSLESWDGVVKAQPKRTAYPDTVYTLLGLARCHIAHGEMPKAMDFLFRALKLSSDSYGTDSLGQARVLNVAAGCLLADKKYDAAAQLLQKSVRIHTASLKQILGFASEQEMFSAAGPLRYGVALRTHISTLDPDNEPSMNTAFYWLVQTKGLILETVCRYRDLEKTSTADGVLAEQLREYRHLKQRVADATLGPTALAPTELKTMSERIAELQAATARRHSDLQVKAEPKLFREDVRVKLPPGSALIEFVNIDVSQLVPGERNYKRVHKYAAFVLPADPNKPLRLFDLGNAEEIDADLKALRERLVPFDPDQEARQERNFKKASAALYAKLLQPLENAIEGTDSLILSPDGTLHQVPFAALVNGEGKYLVETHRLRFITSCRDLFREPAKKIGEGIVVFADPDFDLDPALRAKNNGPAKAAPTRGPEVTMRLGWKRLEATRQEAADIAAAMPEKKFGAVKIYQDAAATEEQVKLVRSPRILHFATHGMFVPRLTNLNQEVLSSPSSRQMAAENPLLRSAVVLAGANRIAKPNEAHVEDGLLTAEEVALLELHGTDLVVLSACESGLGEFATGEGVQGLRRAFLYAGARSVVATLYPVPDKETAQLMKAFYSELAAGKGKLESLHAAQLKMIKARRGEGNMQPAHPIYWAAFVLVGEER